MVQIDEAKKAGDARKAVETEAARRAKETRKADEAMTAEDASNLAAFSRFALVLLWSAICALVCLFAPGVADQFEIEHHRSYDMAAAGAIARPFAHVPVVRGREGSGRLVEDDIFYVDSEHFLVPGVFFDEFETLELSKADQKQSVRLHW